MTEVGRRFVTGQGRWWSPAVVFLGALLAVFLAGVVLGTVERGEPTLAAVVYEPLLFPGMFVFAPSAIAAGAAFRGYPPIASLALGLSVGLGFAGLGGLSTLFGTSANGDSPLWAMSLLFAGSGLLTAAIGHAVGLATRLALDRAS